MRQQCIQRVLQHQITSKNIKTVAEMPGNASCLPNALGAFHTIIFYVYSSWHLRVRFFGTSHFWRSQRSWRKQLRLGTETVPRCVNFQAETKQKGKKELDSSCTKKIKRLAPSKNFWHSRIARAIPTPSETASGGRLGEWFSRWLYWNLNSQVSRGPRKEPLRYPTAWGEHVSFPEVECLGSHKQTRQHFGAEVNSKYVLSLGLKVDGATLPGKFGPSRFIMI